ncbi:MAG: cytochrome P450 [Cyanobacteria bacterium P01_F01_bin.42]
MTDIPPKSDPSVPPGSFGLPIIGESLLFLLDPNFAKKRQARYGSIFKTSILGQKTVVMTGPEASRFLLSTHADHFSWREGWPGTFRELLGESLFLQEGEQHRRNRKLLRPAFHGTALCSYFDTMATLTQNYLDRWETMGSLVWFEEMKQLTFEIASTLLIGNHSGQSTAQLSQWFTELTKGLFVLPIRWPWTTYGKAIAARERLLEHIDAVIEERLESPTEDVLGMLMQSQDENGDRLSREEIKVQALLMLFAGHETTTSMLVSMMMAIAQNPEVWTKAHVEQDALQASGNLDLEQLKQMPYLDQILKEVERLYPPVSGGFRGVLKPFEFEGYHVPAGWKALYRIDETHLDTRCFSNPSQFDPDRFSPERAEHKRLSYSLVGFGGGPRVCLGLAFAKMEMKIVASLLLRNYTWTLEADQDLSLDPIPTLHPRSGLKIQFNRRVYSKVEERSIAAPSAV